MIAQLFLTLKGHIYRSWWVFFFALLCFICYEQSIKIRNEQYQALSIQLQELQIEIQLSLLLQTELIAQVHSQTDRAGIEYILMKELGVVPEGHKKIYFIK